MTYPDAIYAICREKAVAVTKVEKDLGWSQGTIRRWEKNIPSIEKVVAVADYLGVSVDAVCGRKTEETIVEKFIAETAKHSPDEEMLLQAYRSMPEDKRFEAMRAVLNIAMKYEH